LGGVLAVLFVPVLALVGAGLTHRPRLIIDKQNRQLIGRSALARNDVPLAANLLGRALDRLEPHGPAENETRQHLPGRLSMWLASLGRVHRVESHADHSGLEAHVHSVAVHDADHGAVENGARLAEREAQPGEQNQRQRPTAQHGVMLNYPP